jgi:hypothetical protein
MFGTLSLADLEVDLHLDRLPIRRIEQLTIFSRMWFLRFWLMNSSTALD